MRPLLRWFGGKYLLAPWIISQFPKHRVYVEPFGGAGSVLFRKPRSYSEVWNDLDDSAYNLFSVLRSPTLSLELFDALVMTPYSRREFELSYVYSPQPVESARRLIVRSFMGFGSNAHNASVKTGFRANSNRSGSTPAHDWVNYPKSVPEFIERLRGVVIENRDAVQVMNTHDGPETLHYVDPPYPLDTRNPKHRYLHEMTLDGHAELCSVLKTLKGKVIVSGYDSEIYTALGWRSVERNAYADGAQKRVEKLWLNFPEEIGDFF